MAKNESKYKPALRNDVELGLNNWMFVAGEEITAVARLLGRTDSDGFRVKLWCSEFDTESGKLRGFVEVPIDQPPGFGGKSRPVRAVKFDLGAADKPGQYRLEIVDHREEVAAEAHFMVIQQRQEWREPEE